MQVFDCGIGHQHGAGDGSDPGTEGGNAIGQVSLNFRESLPESNKKRLISQDKPPEQVGGNKKPPANDPHRGRILADQL